MAYLPAVVMVGRYFPERRARPGSQHHRTRGSARSTHDGAAQVPVRGYGWRTAMFIRRRVPEPVCVRGAHEAPLAWDGRR